MSITIALCQISSKDDPRMNIKKAEKIIKEGKQRDVDFYIFPEYFMCYYPSDNYVKSAQSLDGEFVSELKELAKEQGVWIMAGCNEVSLSEKNRCYNTIVLISREGKLAGKYHKYHLFDVSPYKESNHTIAGETYFKPIQTDFGVVGIGTCYDLRFPELSKFEAENGCNLMCYPSAWVDGTDKYQQWEALLRQRALEHQMYVIGCSLVDEKQYMGKSLVIDPDGKILSKGQGKEEILYCKINL